MKYFNLFKFDYTTGEPYIDESSSFKTEGEAFQHLLEKAIDKDSSSIRLLGYIGTIVIDAKGTRLEDWTDEVDEAQRAAAGEKSDFEEHSTWYGI